LAASALWTAGTSPSNIFKAATFAAGTIALLFLGSKYAEGVAGVPLAAFGAMAYGSVIAAAVFAACGSKLGRQALVILATIMALVSLWLVYLQAFVIHSFCKYCLASAAASWTLAGLVLIERLITPPHGQSPRGLGAK